MGKRELAQAIHKVSYLQGEFTLRSGQTSPEYFDKYRFESQPHLLKAIAVEMRALIPKGTQVLAGLEMGGIPVVTALSMETGLPAVFVRKKAKTYGTCRVAEGLESLKGLQVCIVEDVITTGGQVLLSAEDLRKEGAVVSHVVCVISRQNSGEEKLRAAGLGMSSLFTGEQIKSSVES